MQILIMILLFIVPFVIAKETGRSGLAVFITTLLFIFIFTVMNARGGHLNEALGFAFGLSMFVALFSCMGAYIGARFHQAPKKLKLNSEMLNDANDKPE